MNIAFDATAILGPFSKNRGIGNYALAQFISMIENDQDNDYYFFNLLEEFSMEERINKGNVKDCFYYTGEKNELYANPEYKDIIGGVIKRFIKENNIDVFYITSPFESCFVRYKEEWFKGIKTVATVYDIIPYVMKEHYLSDKNTYNYYMECVDMLRWVDEYLVISQSVKDDMIKYLNFPEERIHVIYGASDNKIYKQIEISDSEKKELYDKFGICGKYIMCTGGDDERKNIEGLIRAYADIKPELIKEYQLVIVCKLSPQSVERYTAVSKELNIVDRVVLTNFVSTEELIQLYNLASLMAFPSRYEGFGLPIVEAWMCGTPVLTSINSSLGEIGGDGAVLVDADSKTSISEGINRALLEMDLEELLRKGKKRLDIFNWDNVSELAIKVINSIKLEDLSVKRMKIAMFTPLPPIESGISDYSVDIINELSKTVDVDVYVDNYEAEQFNENVNILKAKEFTKNKKEYDRVVYQMGNSLFHEYMLPYIRKYPGVVVLHDYNMRNVLEAMYLYKKSDPKTFEKLLSEDLNKDQIDDYMKHLNSAYLEKYEINGFVTNYAEQIIVHSEYAKRGLIEKDISRDVTIIPLYTIVEGYDKNDAKEKLGISKDMVVFAAFGHIHNTKRPIPILQAYAKILKENENSILYFVGKLDKSVENKFNEIIQENGLKDRVIVTGYTELEEFKLYMDATDVNLNLRYPYNGESSASFMRLLGKGKCVIVNDIGSFSEVPEDSCIRIRNVKEMTSEEEVNEIYQAMRKALDGRFRKNVEDGAYRYAEKELDISIIGKKYVDVIAMENRSVLTEDILKNIVKECRINDDNDLHQLSHTLSCCV